MATFIGAYTSQYAENERYEITRDITLKKVAAIVKDVTTEAFHPMASLAANLSANHAFQTENTTEQFHRYLKSKDLIKRYPNVISWVYAARMDANNFEAELTKIDREPGRSALGYRPVKVFPEPTEGVPLAPVVISEPPSVRQKLLGFNVLLHKPRRDVAMKALKTGTIQMTGPVDLRVNTDGVILFKPVYSTEKTPQTYEERFEKHIGFVLTANTTDSLSETVSKQFETLGLDVDIYDYGSAGSATHPEIGYNTLLSSSRWGHPVTNAGICHPPLDLANPRVDQMDIEVAGRIWRVIVQTNTAGFRQHDFFTLMIVIVGILLSVLTSAFVFLQQNAARHLSLHVDNRTRELKEAHEALQKSRDQAQAQALTDPLTGLGNRRFLSNEFSQIKSSTTVEDLVVSVVVFDIDFFKSINDTKGHDFGDKILCAFADRVSEDMKDDVTGARLGGDEFVFLMTSPKNRCNSAKTTTRLLKIIQRVGKENDMPSLTGSAGIAQMTSQDNSLSDVMKHADIALYEAKQNGRNGYVKYTHALGERETQKNAVLSAVAEGLNKDAFVPAFHPFVDLKSGKITGFEVLARWQHETKGLLTPASFWEALEDDAVATQISMMVMKKAFKQAGELVKRGFDVGRLGINTTEQMLKNKYFVKALLNLAAESHLTSRNLKIEVTERILLSRETQDIMETLSRLAEKGVSIAFDDFGTGFASLTHLRTFPIDCVKIDRSFVQEIETDAKSRTIIAAVGQMAHELGFTVIAEGIETEKTAAILKDLQCDSGQGFLYGKPTDVQGIEKLLLRHFKKAA